MKHKSIPVTINIPRKYLKVIEGEMEMAEEDGVVYKKTAVEMLEALVKQYVEADWDSTIGLNENHLVDLLPAKFYKMKKS